MTLVSLCDWKWDGLFNAEDAKDTGREAFLCLSPERVRHHLRGRCSGNKVSTADGFPGGRFPILIVRKRRVILL